MNLDVSPRTPFPIYSLPHIHPFTKENIFKPILIGRRLAGTEMVFFRLSIDGPDAAASGTYAYHRVRRLRTERPRQHGVRAAGHRVPVETTTTTASQTAAAAAAALPTATTPSATTAAAASATLSAAAATTSATADATTAQRVVRTEPIATRRCSPAGGRRRRRQQRRQRQLAQRPPSAVVPAELADRHAHPQSAGKLVRSPHVVHVAHAQAVVVRLARRQRQHLVQTDGYATMIVTRPLLLSS